MQKMQQRNHVAASALRRNKRTMQKGSLGYQGCGVGQLLSAVKNWKWSERISQEMKWHVWSIKVRIFPSEFDAWFRLLGTVQSYLLHVTYKSHNN